MSISQFPHEQTGLSREAFETLDQPFEERRAVSRPVSAERLLRLGLVHPHVDCQVEQTGLSREAFETSSIPLFWSQMLEQTGLSREAFETPSSS